MSIVGWNGEIKWWEGSGAKRVLFGRTFTLGNTLETGSRHPISKVLVKVEAAERKWVAASNKVMKLDDGEKTWFRRTWNTSARTGDARGERHDVNPEREDAKPGIFVNWRGEQGWCSTFKGVVISGIPTVATTNEDSAGGGGGKGEYGEEDEGMEEEEKKQEKKRKKK